MKVGLVGCGNIATDLCIALRNGGIHAEIAALTDIDAGQAEQLRKTYDLDAGIGDLEDTVRVSDFVVECAAAEAVHDVIESVIRHRKSCVIMSVAGLLKEPELLDKAKHNNVRVQIPSGAICGLDGIRTAAEAGLDRVVLTTRKPTRGLAGEPYLVEKGIDADKLTEPAVVFEGTALEAVKALPKNVNVAGALSFAGIGPDRTHVRVIIDPDATVNTHEIVAEGDFGRLCTTTENMPSPRNPKSSYLASLSACAELRAAATAFISCK